MGGILKRPFTLESNAKGWRLRKSPAESAHRFVPGFLNLVAEHALPEKSPFCQGGQSNKKNVENEGATGDMYENKGSAKKDLAANPALLCFLARLAAPIPGKRTLRIRSVWLPPEVGLDAKTV